MRPTSKLTEWVVTFAVMPLLVALVLWIASNTWDVQTRMVKVEVKVEAMEKSLDRIENNTAPHDGRMAGK